MRLNLSALQTYIIELMVQFDELDKVRLVAGAKPVEIDYFLNDEELDIIRKSYIREKFELWIEKKGEDSRDTDNAWFESLYDYCSSKADEIFFKKNHYHRREG